MVKITPKSTWRFINGTPLCLRDTAARITHKIPTKVSIEGIHEKLFISALLLVKGHLGKNLVAIKHVINKSLNKSQIISEQ